MQHGIILRIIVTVGFIVGIACTAAHAAPEATQTFTLHPGWNAVFLEVQPEPHDPASVFEGLPVESVWTWLERHTTQEFIQNPNEGLWGQPGWCAYFTSEKQVFLTNLFAVFANWPYLIKLGGTDAVTWTVTGAPSVKKIKWVANSFNLVGFHVAPGSPPTFAEFFSPSPAHAGQAIYRLNQQGNWEFVADPGAARVRSGEAYWVYCEGTSTYQSPLRVEASVDGLNYSTFLTEQAVKLENLSDVSRTITFTLSPPVEGLTYRDFDRSMGYFTWPPLAAMPALSLAPGRQANVRLAVRRAMLSSGLTESVISVTDDKGIRFLVPVSVEK